MNDQKKPTGKKPAAATEPVASPEVPPEAPPENEPSAPPASTSPASTSPEPSSEPVATLTLGEVRLFIRGFSNPKPVMTVRGTRRVDFYFFRNDRRSCYERRYVAGQSNPAKGIFPMDTLRGELDDLFTSPHLPRELKLQIEMLTPAEHEAQETKLATQLKAEQEARAEADRVSREMAEQAKRMAEDAEKIRTGEMDPPAPELGGLAALKQKVGGARPSINIGRK